MILARSLAGAVGSAGEQLGGERSAWQWGKLHTYSWTTETTQLAQYMSASQRTSINAIKGYLDQPVALPGRRHGTLNVAAYKWVFQFFFNFFF